MNISYRRLSLALPLAGSLLLGGCAGPAYYADEPYGSGGSVYITDSSRPYYNDNYPYYYGGRYYTGGRYETGRYVYKGRNYDNRYYHNGQYYYGGSRQQRPSNVPCQSPNRPAYHSNQQRPPYQGPVQGQQRTQTQTPTRPVNPPQQRTATQTRIQPQAKVPSQRQQGEPGTYRQGSPGQPNGNGGNYPGGKPHHQGNQ